MTWLWVPLRLVLVLHAYREYWTSRNLRQLHHRNFTGELLKVGTTYIARRAPRS